MTTTSTLRQLLPSLTAAVKSGSILLDEPISGIALDSRNLEPHNCYIAYQPDPRNPSAHGGHYIQQALTAGARVILLDALLLDVLDDLDENQRSRVAIIDGLRNYVGHICAAWSGSPALESAVIGITGTNGKTSCAWFMAQAPAVSNGQRAGAFIGTLGSGFLADAGADDWQDASHTTPDAAQLQKHLQRLKPAELIAVEVSSHALVQQRCKGTSFTVAMFTNLSQDHLDYHGDMSAYLDAKALLFTDYPVESAVVVIDDDSGEQLAGVIAEQVSSGRINQLLTVSVNQSADIQVTLLDNAGSQGLRLQLQTPLGGITVQTRLMGDFNAANIGVVCAGLLALKWSLADIQAAIEGLEPVPGRMQPVSDRPLVVVDFAHTPAALETLLSGIRKQTAARLWCVVGCGGDRDRGKRPLMAEIASRLADKVIFTSDNPRNETPESIIQDMLAGVSDVNAEKVEYDTDRKIAIGRALQQAADNDCVVIAGKGHERYQQIGNARLPFDDAQIARDWLEQVA